MGGWWCCGYQVGHTWRSDTGLGLGGQGCVCVVLQCLGQTVLLEKTPESPWDKPPKIKPANLKGDQPRIFTGRTDGEAEAPVFWSSVANIDAGKDWGKKEKRATEDEMTGWHHWGNEHELGQTPGDGEGQGSLACYGPRGREKSDITWRLNNNKLAFILITSYNMETAQWDFDYTVNCSYLHKLNLKPRIT